MWIVPSASIDGVALAAATLGAALVTGSFTWLVAASKHRREAADQATQVLRHNRDPLLRAVFDLQSRIYNIVARGFLDQYWRAGNEEEKQYARYSTLWLFGQFLGWTEILRREVQFLDLGSRATNRRVQLRLNDVAAALASDSYGRDDTFVLFRSDQRAVGEFMVTERDTQNGRRPDCLGYWEFTESLTRLEDQAEKDSVYASSPVVGWAKRVGSNMDGVADDASHARLVRVQRRLVNLLDLLDPDRLRYPRPDLRGKLPWLGADAKPEPKQVARFVWPWGDPWQRVEGWERERHLEVTVRTPTERSCRGRLGVLGGRPEFRLIFEDGWFTISAWTARGKRRRRIDGTLRARKARLMLDDLLHRFDRPLVNQATQPFRVVEWVRRLPRRLVGRR